MLLAFCRQSNWWPFSPQQAFVGSGNWTVSATLRPYFNNLNEALQQQAWTIEWQGPEAYIETVVNFNSIWASGAFTLACHIVDVLFCTIVSILWVVFKRRQWDTINLPSRQPRGLFLELTLRADIAAQVRRLFEQLLVQQLDDANSGTDSFDNMGLRGILGLGSRVYVKSLVAEEPRVYAKPLAAEDPVFQAVQDFATRTLVQHRRSYKSSEWCPPGKLCNFHIERLHNSRLEREYRSAAKSSQSTRRLEAASIQFPTWWLMDQPGLFSSLKHCSQASTRSSSSMGQHLKSLSKSGTKASTRREPAIVLEQCTAAAPTLGGTCPNVISTLDESANDRFCSAACCWVIRTWLTRCLGNRSGDLLGDRRVRNVIRLWPWLVARAELWTTASM